MTDTDQTLTAPPADADGKSHIESADNYRRVVARLNGKWRVIACRDGIQWILQRRHGPERPAGARWEGRSYCRTSEALRRCAR
jgi:hypothetical protein